MSQNLLLKFAIGFSYINIFLLAQYEEFFRMLRLFPKISVLQRVPSARINFEINLKRSFLNFFVIKLIDSLSRKNQVHEVAYHKYFYY